MLLLLYLIALNQTDIQLDFPTKLLLLCLYLIGDSSRSVALIAMMIMKMMMIYDDDNDNDKTVAYFSKTNVWGTCYIQGLTNQ